MAITSEYVPSPSDWVRKQVETIERTGTTDSVDIMGLPVVMLTMRGAKTGAIRKVPLMRVEHEGAFAAVASQAEPRRTRTGTTTCSPTPTSSSRRAPRRSPSHARELEGEEREQWWERCVSAFPSYAGYQTKTDRLIPVFVLERR